MGLHSVMSIDVSQLRESYTQGGMEKEDLSLDPFTQFDQWMQTALDSKLAEPNAMTLSTVNQDGIPSSRTVLLKGLDHGFCLFSNYRSQKAQDIQANPNVSLTFLWLALERQVIIQGSAEKMSVQESESYFKSRPYESQIGAWVSQEQSGVIPDRAELVARDRLLKTQYPEGNVPLPEFWGGFRIIPSTVEFWQGRVGRLHDRLRYVRDGEAWGIERLSP